MEFENLIEDIVSNFNSDPRNKVFASQDLLIASVFQESGKRISPETLLNIVRSYKEGDIDGDDEELYDAATYCCSVLARKCFADDPDNEDVEVDYILSWIENEDGSLSAEIRPY